MALEITPASDRPAEGIKHVPQDDATRAAIRSMAVQLTADISRARPPLRGDLEQLGLSVLKRLDLPTRYLGFAMVAVSNEFWRPAFLAIPYHRRLFLLPHCLRSPAVCAGKYDSVGLHCVSCGSCEIHNLKQSAEQLGYTVVVAEGTSSALMKILDGEADAIFGVACLDSLEKSFHRVAELGVPHVALPLLKDGCVDTQAEIDQIQRMLAEETALCPTPPRSYLPLLRHTSQMFHQPLFAHLLSPYDGSAANQQDPSLGSVHAIACDWLREGGKRLRPFVTIAAYAVARHGMSVVDRGNQQDFPIPPSIQRLALAIEALHKASLVHDDIEDHDEFRYGRPTLHCVHGVGQAINIGDYLIGLGYRLVAGEANALGADCISDILGRLSHAHLELCRGQGAELAWQKRPHDQLRPMDVLTIYALKTAPAFEVALYAGLRAAGVSFDAAALRRFSTFLGEGFQIRNDLDDWREDDRNKRKSGLDALAARPTILRVFAAEKDHTLLRPRNGDEQSSTDGVIERVRNLYNQSGAFAKAEQLLTKLRSRAIDAAGEFPGTDLQELMRFLVRIVLPQSAESEVSGR
jgi:geranylgeranyl pyrophosphate synthase